MVMKRMCEERRVGVKLLLQKGTELKMFRFNANVWRSVDRRVVQKRNKIIF